MEPALLDILREAVETKQRKEDLDRSLGRALRRHDMSFDVYVKMISELRELAAKEGVPLDDIARRILAQHQKDSD